MTTSRLTEVPSRCALRYSPSGRPFRLMAGASGDSFKEWKGTFYPQDIKPEGMLAFYGERLPNVEINSTFYRMPKSAVLENWAATVPAGFRFAITASQRITHMSRIKAESAAEPLAILYQTLAALGAGRGPVLFQLPPNLKKARSHVVACNLRLLHARAYGTGLRQGADGVREFVAGRKRSCR